LLLSQQCLGQSAVLQSNDPKAWFPGGFSSLNCKALTGNYQAEHLFALKQALHLYDAYQVQIHECDSEIEKTLALLSLDSPTPDKPLPKARHRTKQPNALNFDVRQSLYDLICVDLTQIHGIGHRLVPLLRCLIITLMRLPRLAGVTSTRYLLLGANTL
jgi:hypothetical protein